MMSLLIIFYLKNKYNTMDFKMNGNKTKLKLWNWLLKISQKKVKKYEQDIVNVISVNFPSAFCLIIRYEIINEGCKYEIVSQGDYSEIYKKWKESEETIIPENVKVEYIIKEKHKVSQQNNI